MDLVAKLEAATEGSRELDIEIALASGWTPLQVECVDGPATFYCEPGMHGAFTAVPKFSDSLDAALSLVPEGFNWAVYGHWRLPIEKPVFRYSATVEVNDGKNVTGEHSAEATTPALALCIAALKSRHQAHGNHPGQDDQKEVTHG